MQLIKVTSEASQETKLDVEFRFAIGPSVQRELWAKERTNMEKYHGPCTNTAHDVSSCRRVYLILTSHVLHISVFMSFSDEYDEHSELD